MRQSNHPPIRVFISHSSKDRAFTKRLAALLKSNGIEYWYSATHIAGAKQWHDEIGQALARCTWFLVVLTPQAVRSAWVKRELLFALNDVRYNQRIIPVLRKPCQYALLSWTLPGFQFVDFTGTFDAGSRRLLRVWNIASKTTHKNRLHRKGD